MTCAIVYGIFRKLANHISIKVVQQNQLWLSVKGQKKSHTHRDRCEEPISKTRRK